VANHPSALKRQRQSEKRRARNKNTKSAIKKKIRTVRQSVSGKEAAKAKEQLAGAIRAIDRAVTGGTFHPRTASRKISRLTKLVNKIAGNP
jgi:small subunit ribosomal protein S20